MLKIYVADSDASSLLHLSTLAARKTGTASGNPIPAIPRGGLQGIQVGAVHADADALEATLHADADALKATPGPLQPSFIDLHSNRRIARFFILFLKQERE
jgi:hypothetical protein